MEEIASIIGCNKKTISSKLKKFNIKRIHKSKQNLIGKKFGRLTIIKYSYTKKRKIYWICKCDCGTIKSISVWSLLNGATKSCGCLNLDIIHLKKGHNHPKSTGYKDITGNYWSGVKSNAKERNLNFSISKEYIWNLYEQQNKKCALSGIPLIFSGYSSTIEQTASIDRIDSNQGYIEGNIQIIHKDINIFKHKIPQEKFIKYCNLIAKQHPR